MTTTVRPAEELKQLACVERETARSEYKKFVQVQNRMKGISPRHEIAKDTKLRLNRESAAAARYANKVYKDALERLVEESENEQSMLSLEAARSRSARDELAEQVHFLQCQLVQLRGDQGDEDPEEVESVCSTKLLLERVAHIPELRMTPAQFALRLMGVAACPAL